MNSEERQMIEGLFTRLGEAERQAPPRDGEAESLIRERITARPATPYYMAQTMIVQDETLKAAQARIEELERALREQPAPAGGGGGGFLGGLFGGGGARDGQRLSPPSPAASGYGAAPGPWGSAPASPSMPAPTADGRSGGGGFLAGAAQTVVGVAGGVMLGSMLGNLVEGSGHSFLGGGASGLGGGETVVENDVTENFYGSPADTTGIDNANFDEPDIENADSDGMDSLDLDGNDDI